MARTSQGEKLYFGSTDADFIGVGASIFLTITLLIFTVSNLIGHLPPTLLEVNLSISQCKDDDDVVEGDDHAGWFCPDDHCGRPGRQLLRRPQP